MILFSTTTAHHLAQKMDIAQGAYTVKKFSDGELSITIDQKVAGKQVWVIAGTQPPAENLLELLLLLDALQRAGASINLLVTYFSYARQAHAGELIGTMLRNFALHKIVVVHPHTDQAVNTLHDIAICPLDFFCQQAAAYDAIAAPDQGAALLAKQVAKKASKELILLQKKRIEHERVTVLAVDGQVTGKKILLVDDIISTGSTIIAAANELKRLGARSVAAAATHGLFCAGARELLEASLLEKIVVTNTIDQPSPSKIQVVDIGSMLTKSLHNI